MEAGFSVVEEEIYCRKNFCCLTLGEALEPQFRFLVYEIGLSALVNSYMKSHYVCFM